MPDDASASHETQPVEIDSTCPHPARIWNYMLGGKDNYPADQMVADQFIEMFPAIRDEARTSRYCLTRVVRYLAGEVGIRQFLDIGTGLPTVDNTHEVAQRVAPDSKIVYVDNDPLVLVHARALLTSTPEGRTDYIDADLHDPETILRKAAKTLDFTQPIAVILMGILGFITDCDEARSIVRRLLDALPSGSYITIYDGTDVNEEFNEANRVHNETPGNPPYRLRTPEQIRAYFDGLELVEPGVVRCPLWRPELAAVTDYPQIIGEVGVARKP